MAAETPAAAEAPAPDVRRRIELTCWLGWGAVVLGALLQLAFDATEARTAGLALVIAGALAAAAGHLWGRRVEGSRPDEPRYRDPGERIEEGAGARRVLALGGLGLTLLGLGLLAKDVFTETRSATPWLPLVAGTLALIAAAAWSSATTRHPRGRRVVQSPPGARWRRASIGTAVIAVLLVQAMIPLRYYLGHDLFDERFSWRMFSAVRVYQCNLQAYETRGGVESETPLMRTIHVGWITTLRRNREAVMERYLQWRCEQEGVEAARLVNRCTTPEGNPVPDVVRTIRCSEGEVRRGPAEPDPARASAAAPSTGGTR